jgi:hypothetical protein
MITNVYWSLRYSCQIVMKLEFSQEIFEKTLKFHFNPSSGSRVVLCGDTDMKKLIVFAISRTRLIRSNLSMALIGR